MESVDITFEGGVTLRGRLFLPAQSGRRPAITMAHGFAATIQHGLTPFAQAFAEAGFVASWSWFTTIGDAEPVTVSHTQISTHGAK